VSLLERDCWSHCRATDRTQRKRASQQYCRRHRP